MNCPACGRPWNRGAWPTENSGPIGSTSYEEARCPDPFHDEEPVSAHQFGGWTR